VFGTHFPDDRRRHRVKFRSVIKLSGKTATGIEVPPEVVSGLGTSKRPAVRVTMGGYTYRSSVAAMGGVFMLPVSAEHRAGAGVEAGDEVDVDVELDTEPREVSMPVDFSSALDKNPDAKTTFEGLSYSHQLRHVLADRAGEDGGNARQEDREGA
jgi:hypothetical protein